MPKLKVLSGNAPIDIFSGFGIALDTTLSVGTLVMVLLIPDHKGPGRSGEI